MNSIYKFLNQFGYEPIGTDGYVLEEIGTGYLYNAYKDYCECECVGEEPVSITAFQHTLKRESFKLRESGLPFDGLMWSVYVKVVDPKKEKRTIGDIGHEISAIDDNVCEVSNMKDVSDFNNVRIVIEEVCGDDVSRVVLLKDVLYVEGFLENYIDQCDDRLLELKEEMKGAELYYE